MTDTAKLLVVEDDSEVREALGRALRLEGFEVELAPGGEEALKSIGKAAPDAIILDVSMPGLDGYGVARALRSCEDQTPVLMLTARDTVQDRVRGLNSGADDYLVKPFALVELVARVNALLRRAGQSKSEPPQELIYGDLVLDLGARQLRRGGSRSDLTKTEFDLLELLLRNAGRVVTRAVIMDRVWGYDAAPGSNSMEVFVSTLRRKTEQNGLPRLIHTVRGVGYTVREATQ